MKHPTPQKKIKHRTLGVFALVFALLLAVLALLNHGLVKQEKLKAAYTAESTVANIEAQLNRYLAESELLKNVVESGYAINDKDFAALSELMSDKDGVIKAVELAPNGIVQYIYPLAENKGVIGLNMLQHPERKVEANLAKDSGQYTIAGPFELLQGGTGALLFDPIYTTDENGNQKYWGFSLLVLDWKSFLDEVQITKLADASYEYRIWKDGYDGEPVTIAESSHPVSADTLSVACSVPNDTWHFEIRPYSGWISTTQLAFDVLLLLGLPALAAGWAATWWYSRRRATQVKSYTDRLLEQIWGCIAGLAAFSTFVICMEREWPVDPLFPVLLLISAGLFISGTVIHNKYMYYVSCFLLPVAFGIIRESWINVTPDGNLIQFAVAVLVGLTGSGYALKRQVKRDAAEASENR